MYGAGRFGGEPCYVPKGEDLGIGSCGSDDGEGFVMSFVRDEKEERSELVIVEASTMVQVASVRLPTRVPYGIHENFFATFTLSIHEDAGPHLTARLCLFGWTAMDKARSLFLISVKDGLDSGSKDQHSSINFLHSGSQFAGIYWRPERVANNSSCSQYFAR
ncbi:hypothetical protein Tsubulata_037757 [Turnera subulata]|uniref:Uncharacterized protein n=1 Tax=Turnera subulata TaxID=218843 RepID=A0A9Q0GD19_9ROSI|nr:hypothetical protein Tsubulata_037757 [Turnera subulata]